MYDDDDYEEFSNYYDSSSLSSVLPFGGQSQHIAYQTHDMQDEEYDDTDFMTQHQYQSNMSSEPIDQWDSDNEIILPRSNSGTHQPGGTSQHPQHRPRQLPVSAWQHQMPQPSMVFQSQASQLKRGAEPRNGHGIRLRPVTDLSDVYRGIFKFGVFNAIQSSCYDTVVKSDDNVVVSAPTGSGKTVLFELSVIRMLLEMKKTGHIMRAVYVAPTKALCSERFRDWTAKFERLGIKCAELTGDTVSFGRGAWGDAKNATIIITTSEKWDSLTRSWADSRGVLSSIALFMVDEVHILKESRGSCLEVVMSRMRHRGSDVRFILVSATVPNIRDIACWINLNPQSTAPAKIFQFGEEFRPCKLTRHVIGVPRPKQSNDFVFSRTLDFKLFGALQKYSSGKPTLVFVPTRKGTMQTAEQLKKEFLDAEYRKNATPWTRPPRIDHVLRDKNLKDLVPLGIGFHHAGLQMDDRRAVEELFLNRMLKVLVATSTLAVGVNLPAHTVVIKGVKMFQDGSMIEYTDLDIMQMLGRAGRPQFDNEGVAIILCESQLERKYREMVQGQTVLESNLHLNLVEHINSEIGLGTITNIASAKSWLRQSFLFQRIKQNPSHYSMGKDDGQTWDERVDDLVLHSVARLREAQLVETPSKGDDPSLLQLTEYGDIMSKFYIRLATMCQILELPERVGLRELLELISSSEEVTSSKLRSGEKSVLNVLRKHPEIRFPVTKIESTSDKMMVLLQAQLACINLTAPEFKISDSQLAYDVSSAFKHTTRIARAIVEVATVRKLGTHMKYGLELIRSLSAKAWDDRPYVLRQIESIGEKSIKILAEHGITTIDRLRRQDPLRIENLLNRRPPFGHDVLHYVKELPQYTVKIEQMALRASEGGKPVEIDLKITCSLVEETATASKTKKRKIRSSNVTNVLTLTSDMEFIDYRRIGTKALSDGRSFELAAVPFIRPSQSIVIYIASDSVAGLAITKTFKPSLPSNQYPILNTRPVADLELDLESLEESGYWDLTDVNDDEPACSTQSIAVRDLTKKKPIPDGPANITTSENSNRKEPQISDIPVQLSNGKYACNHSCKDKTACRHMCCREGLNDPPKRRQNAKAAPPSRPPESNSPTTTRSPRRVGGALTLPQKQSPMKKDTTLFDLEKLHEKHQVAERIKLPEGSRIIMNKTSISVPRKREKQPPPSYDVVLSDLSPAKTTSNIYRVPDQLRDDDDIDDVPDPSQLFSRKFQSPLSLPSTPNNTESRLDCTTTLDSMPIDDDRVEEEYCLSMEHRSPSPIIVQLASKRSSSSFRKPSQNEEDSSLLQTSLSIESATKRRDWERADSISWEDVEPPLKRSRVSSSVSDPRMTEDILTATNPAYRNHSAIGETPLFLPSGDEIADTTNVAMATRFSSSPPLASPIHAIVSSDPPEAAMQNEEWDDDLADFEKWLQSGAVKIVD